MRCPNGCTYNDKEKNPMYTILLKENNIERQFCSGCQTYFEVTNVMPSLRQANESNRSREEPHDFLLRTMRNNKSNDGG